jgi:radical SAM-linked protein
MPPDIHGDPPSIKQKDIDFEVFVFKVARTGTLRFLSQREFVTSLERVFRRAGFPVWLSKGFHPRMKMEMNRALPTGVSSQAEYFSIRTRYDPYRTLPYRVSEVLNQCNACSPRGIRFLFARKVPDSFSLNRIAQVWSFQLIVPALHMQKNVSSIDLSRIGVQTVIERGRFYVIQYSCTSADWIDYRTILQSLFRTDTPSFFYIPLLKEVYVDGNRKISVEASLCARS